MVSKVVLLFLVVVMLIVALALVVLLVLVLVWVLALYGMNIAMKSTFVYIFHCGIISTIMSTDKLIGIFTIVRICSSGFDLIRIRSITKFAVKNKVGGSISSSSIISSSSSNAT